MSNFRFTRPDPFPPVVKNLIIINVLVFLVQGIFDKQYHITELFALYPVDDYNFRPYQIATHMFTHGSIGHLVFNMFGLYIFGKVLENVWGPGRFLIFYFLCGIGAAAAHLFVQHLMGNGVAAIGASGAIMGIFAAFAYLFPNTELYMMFIPVPIKAKWAVLGMAAIDIFGSVAGNDGIAHFAHLGGALTGFILVLIWNRTNRKRFY